MGHAARTCRTSPCGSTSWVNEWQTRLVRSRGSSWISRNKSEIRIFEVRNQAGAKPLSDGVQQARLELMDANLNEPEKHALRDAACTGTWQRPLTDAFVRKVGRPSP